MHYKKYLPLILTEVRLIASPMTMGSGTLPLTDDTRIEMQDFSDGKLTQAGIPAKVTVAPGQTEYTITDFEDGTVMFKDRCTGRFVEFSTNHKEIQHDAPIRCDQLPKIGTVLATNDVN